ncbi:MAG: hypothetical protein J6U14_06390 [Bacteroidaceae bacterium]|nr:hypothetical protein [Bacteroidaceae bacterium]
MKNEVFFSLKNQALFCFLCSVGVLLSAPSSYEYDTHHILLLILSIATFFIAKKSTLVKALSIAACLKAIHSLAYSQLLFYVYDVLSNSYYEIISFLILVELPILFAIVKVKELPAKVFLAILAITIFMQKLMPFTDSTALWVVLESFSFYVFLISLVLFFIASYSISLNKVSRNLSVLALVASAFVLFVALTGVLFEFNDRSGSPSFDSLAGDYSTYAICRKIIHYSSCLIFIAGVLKASYFANFLKSSKMALKRACIPAIVGMLLFGVVYAIAAYHDNAGFNLWSYSDLVLIKSVVYILLAYSFYAFYRSV